MLVTGGAGGADADAGAGAGAGVAAGVSGVAAAAGVTGVTGITGVAGVTTTGAVTRSKAPMSHVVPCGRAVPRWSNIGQPLFVPASIAGLEAPRARVSVCPPLSASAPRSGSVLSRLPAPVNPQEASLDRLLVDVVVVLVNEQLPAFGVVAVLPAKIVFLAISRVNPAVDISGSATPALSMPPPTAAVPETELPAIVEFSSVTVDPSMSDGSSSAAIPPPRFTEAPLSMVLPEIVEFVIVASPVT